MSDNTERLREIRDAIVNLTESPLYEYRVANNYFPVIGQGNHHAQIMFIGEAPGETEAKRGIPFCGRSGKLLDELLESIELNRDDVYITNIVKDRPPENRDPSVEEIRLYAPYLYQQISIIQPQVIATLGRFSMDFILETLKLPRQKISQIHGQVLHAEAQYGAVAVVPLFHPAVGLYRAEQKATLFEDFKVLRGFME